MCASVFVQWSMSKISILEQGLTVNTAQSANPVCWIVEKVTACPVSGPKHEKKLFVICIINAKQPNACFWGDESRQQVRWKRHLAPVSILRTRGLFSFYAQLLANSWWHNSEHIKKKSTTMMAIKGSWESILMVPLCRKSSLFIPDVRLILSARIKRFLSCTFHLFFPNLLALWSH